MKVVSTQFSVSSVDMRSFHWSAVLHENRSLATSRLTAIPLCLLHCW
jgi:hypothetical protein